MAPPTASNADLDRLAQSFERHLRARNRAPRTIRSYTQTLTIFRRFLADHDYPTVAAAITRTHVEAFVADQVARWRPKTALIRYGDLQQFFRWAADAGEITVSPMAATARPHVPETAVPLVSADHLKRLVETCCGSRFEDHRDLAVVLLFVDTGLRLGELAAITVADLDRAASTVVVLGKGRRPRTVPFGRTAAHALDRYLEARSRHPRAAEEALWLGRLGPLTSWGVYQLVRRRARAAGIGDLHPHQLRHTFAHQWQMSDVAANASFDVVRDHQRPGASVCLLRSDLARAG